MTKKLAVMLGLVGLLLIYSIPQLGSGQIDEELPPTEGPLDREQLRVEIELLRLINAMGLSRDQLSELKAMVSELRAAQEGIIKAQLELKDFLLGYQGDPKDFAEAVKPYDEKVAQARKAFEGELQSSVERLKDVLTLRQGEVLREFLEKRTSKGLMRKLDKEDSHHTEAELGICIEAWKDRELLERFRGKMEEFEAKLKEWLKRWGIELFRSKGSLRLYRHPGMMHPEKPMEMFRCPEIFLKFKLLTPPPQLLEEAPLKRFLAEHLDVLEGVLDEKLQRTGAPQTQI